MCGFSGFMSLANSNIDSIALLEEMGSKIRSRGPDSFGTWLDESANLGLVHRRLAIVDLSPAGHQPMTSKNGRFIIAFNGEIYNHLEIRAELELIGDQSWAGHSDTETLLAAIEVWGLKSALQKSVGMFALALWDKQLKLLHLARDRFGEKPLYYGVYNSTLLFGSQLSAIKVHPEFRADISRDSLALLLRHNYIPAPYSIYTGTYKLLPAHIVTFSSDLASTTDEYWSAKEVIENSADSSCILGENDSLSSLESVLKKAISQQMLADVPLGAFLSGGIDSSLIVALMQSQSSKPVKTFSIGFDDPRFNEALFAKDVATHLGTEHTELYLGADDILSVIPKLPEMYDEPFSDSSQIPTYLVSKMAKEHVTVSLSGDAGDELFCGYSRYFLASKSWHKMSKVPLTIRRFLSKFITTVPVKLWNSIFFVMPSKYKAINLGDRLHKAAFLLTSKNIDELYIRLISHWQHPENIVLNCTEPLTAITDPERRIVVKDPLLRMMAYDTVSYLSDDILAKVDRAAMAVSLETRVPFLDHRVFEKAWAMPLSMKYKHKKSKWCLRQILYKYVPENMIERPKMGFAIPLDVWLRGPLREWAENLLSEERLLNEGFFDSVKIRQIWTEHLSGERNWQYHLWDILMFQAWFEHYHKNE